MSTKQVSDFGKIVDNDEEMEEGQIDLNNPSPVDVENKEAVNDKEDVINVEAINDKEAVNDKTLTRVNKYLSKLSKSPSIHGCRNCGNCYYCGYSPDTVFAILHLEGYQTAKVPIKLKNHGGRLHITFKIERDHIVNFLRTNQRSRHIYQKLDNPNITLDYYVTMGVFKSGSRAFIAINGYRGKECVKGDKCNNMMCIYKHTHNWKMFNSTNKLCNYIVNKSKNIIHIYDWYSVDEYDPSNKYIYAGYHINNCCTYENIEYNSFMGITDAKKIKKKRSRSPMPNYQSRRLRSPMPNYQSRRLRSPMPKYRSRSSRSPTPKYQSRRSSRSPTPKYQSQLSKYDDTHRKRSRSSSSGTDNDDLISMIDSIVKERVNKGKSINIDKIKREISKKIKTKIIKQLVE